MKSILKERDRKQNLEEVGRMNVKEELQILERFTKPKNTGEVAAARKEDIHKKKLRKYEVLLENGRNERHIGIVAMQQG